MAMILLFWISVSLLIYVYLGYPLLLRLVSSLRPQPSLPSGTQRPTVTVIISAFNEEHSIRGKIEGVLGLPYPADLLDVIIVSDGSTDGTDDIVRSVKSQRVTLLRQEGRQGKTSCQNLAVSHAKGTILVFTDATTMLRNDAIEALVANFANPAVGCVAGLLTYRPSAQNITATGGLSYWRYEIAVRQSESRLGTLIGVSGCLYAVRRSAYRAIDPNLISDFVIAMRMREQSLQTILEPRALCFEQTLHRSKHELSMRVRVAVRSITALVSERKFLNLLKDPLFAWQLLSHKVLRYASPYCLLSSLGAAAALASTLFYRMALMLELLILAGGAIGFLPFSVIRKSRLISKPYYFVLTNVASLIATIRFMAGQRMVTWNPIR